VQHIVVALEHSLAQLGGFDAFLEILEHVRAELAPRADQAGSALDEHAVPGPMDAARLRAFLRAVELAREEPDVALLDLNRPRVSGGGPDWTVHFPWRWDQPLPADPSAGGARPAERACLVHIRDDGDDRVAAQAVPIDAQVDRERRAMFVLSHPSLPPLEHELVLAGWIERGMSDDAVRAAWGPPAFCRGDVWIYDRTRRPVTLRFAAGVLSRID
jgi:hypothetical protein